MRRFIWKCIGGLSLSLMFAPVVFNTPARAQTELPIATFPFPSVSNIIADIIIAKGFDKANGLTAKPIVYGTGGALWAGLAKGEFPVHNMSPFQLQKMRGDGVPIVMFGTLLRNLLKQRTFLRVFNISMAVLLVLSLAPLVWH